MKIGQLKYLFVVMIAGILISCSSDAGAEAQQETSDLHYDSPKDFWLSNAVSSSSNAVSSSSIYTSSVGYAGSYGTLIDSRDGQTYKTVIIGTQTVMAENLNYAATDSYCYDDDPANCSAYGRLYSWEAATNACPDGWHLPTLNEFARLSSDCSHSRAGSSGNMLSSKFGWSGTYFGVAVNGKGSDACGFSALPAGDRVYGGGFHGKGDMAVFWKVMECGPNIPNNSTNCFATLAMIIGGDTTSLGRINLDSDCGTYTYASIRCIRNSNNVVKGTMVDSRDGQVYKTVTIGSQTWMAENLNYKTEHSFCYYHRDVNCDQYGRLYTWSAALNACPSGWHLPTREEFETLLDVVGKDSSGTKLKSQTGWLGVSDDYGFSALPAGDYCPYCGSSLDAYFQNSGHNTSFWSASLDSENANWACMMSMSSKSEAAHLDYYIKTFGQSVRCLKGDTPEQIEKSSSSQKIGSSSGGTFKSSSSVKSSSSSEVLYGILTDSRDGQTYKTVKIGSQTWMAENLNYAYLQPTIVLDSTSFCYNNSASYCKKYGRLYTWAAAMDSVGMFSANSKGCGYGFYCSLIYPVRGVCPEGWHLPTQTEWYTLFTAIDDRAITGITLTIAGSKLKSVSGWSDNGNGTDVFSFSALPAGYRRYDDEKYYDAGNGAYFWSSSNELLYTLVGGDCKPSNGEDCKLAYYMYLLYKDDYAALNVRDKFHAYSVRCVKD